MADTQTAAVIGTTRLRGRARLDPPAQRGRLPARLARRGLPRLHRPRGAGRAGALVPGRRPDLRAPRRRRPRAGAGARARRRRRAGSSSRRRAARTPRRWRPRSAARRRPPGSKVVQAPGRDGAVIYAGEDPVAAAASPRASPARRPARASCCPDAAVRNGVEGGWRGRRRAGPCSSPARPSRARRRRCASFEAAFERAYGRRPGPYAALGHAAMQTVLDALTRAAADDQAGRAAAGAARVLLRRRARYRRRPAAGARLGRGRGPRFSAFRLTVGASRLPSAASGP